MPKFFSISLLGCVLVMASCANHSAHPLMPSGALSGGTLTNELLMRDASAGAHAKLKKKGISVKSGPPAATYVLSQPTGKKGLRRWTEEWYFDSRNGRVAVKIDFREMGDNAGWRVRD